MRKIFSILVVLGLVLGMTVAATPAGAAVTGVLLPVVSTNCAGAVANYTITFNISASLHTGSNHIFVEFPEDTVVPQTGWLTGDILFSPDAGVTFYPVFGPEITATGRTVKFMVPVTVTVTPPATQQVVVRFLRMTVPTARGTFGIKNPSVPGKYRLSVWTDRPQDATPVLSPIAGYEIVPVASSYKLAIDFGPEYDGIAPGFIPPLQACEPTAANLTLKAFPVGCAGINCDVWVSTTLLGSPSAASKVTLVVGNATYNLSRTKLYPATGYTNYAKIWSAASLAFNASITWNMTIHLHDVSWHELVFELWTACPDPCDPCGPDPQPAVVTDLPLDIKAVQWLETFEIDLFAKWNLVSIPFEPWDSDIEYMLGSYGGVVPLLSVWHYDQVDLDDWLVFPGDLDEIVDGKAYWMRFFYGQLTATTYITPGDPVGNWWVFGELKSPPTPPAYEVGEGFNMVGITGPIDTTAGAYLWNWAGFPGGFDYGLIYNWNAPGQVFQTQLPGVANLLLGDGYFIPFEFDGYIYP